MRIGPLPQTLTVPAAPASPLLRLGAELQAMVRRGEEGQLLLELEDGQRLMPRSSVPLQSGEQVQLRVLQLQPTTVLQVLSTREQDSPLLTGLRALLSNAGSRTELATGFSQLLSVLATAAPPAQLRPLLAAIAAHIRPPGQLTDAARLAATLRDSGLFLERRLFSETQVPPERDLKAQLLRLSARLQAITNTMVSTDHAAASNPAPRLVDIAEQMLVRLETLQLQAASSQGLDLLFELPMQGDAGVERIQLRIQDDREADGGKPAAAGGGLLVRLRFDFVGEALGAVLRLANDAISVHWWAEQPATAARLQAALPMLAGRLEAVGLNVENLDCLEGAPPPIDDLSILRTRGLLDEKA